MKSSIRRVNYDHGPSIKDVGIVKRQPVGMPYRSPQSIDGVLGRMRFTPPHNIDFSDCPLMKAYPSRIAHE